MDTVARQEVESVVYCPGRWLALSISTVFLLAGVIGFLTLGDVVAPKMPLWFAKPFTGVFATVGGMGTAVTLAKIIFPARVHHASPGVLPGVPKEPVICEGSVVSGRLTHELCERCARDGTFGQRNISGATTRGCCSGLASLSC